MLVFSIKLENGILGIHEMKHMLSATNVSHLNHHTNTFDNLHCKDTKEQEHNATRPVLPTQ
jgi:hypothetical protein